MIRKRLYPAGVLPNKHAFAGDPGCEGVTSLFVVKLLP
jgi:hypothetical protein